MKSWILFSLPFLLLFVSPAQAQKKNHQEVPAPVLKTFKSKFSAAGKAKWEMEDEATWEAEFKMNGKEYSAEFDPDGKWLETEEYIRPEDLSSKVRAALTREFEDYKIKEAAIVKTPTGKSYEVEIQVGKEIFEVTVDSEYQVHRETEDDEEKD